jgi:cell wall-associated NlpC family hydrolase
MATSAARPETETEPVPALQLVARLEPGGAGDAAALSAGLVGVDGRGGSRLRLGNGTRRALDQGSPRRLLGLGLLLALAVAALAAVLSLAGSTAPSGPGQGLASRERVAARLALAGVSAAAGGLLRADGVLTAPDVSGVASGPVPHDLSSAELTALASGTSLYQPAPSLVRAYRSAGAHYGIPWRVIAAVEYLQGGYVDALAGASAPTERGVTAQAESDGRGDVVNAHVLAQASAATGQPSPGLWRDVARLAADGASQSPARGLGTYLQGSDVPVAAVLTLAQSLDPPVASTASGATTSSSAGSATASVTHTASASATAAAAAAAAQAKVSAMLDEARLLHGLPYGWGGGHTNPAWVVGAGYDCSGFVSEVLHSAGYLGSPDTTQTLPGSPGILSGPGKLVTIYDRTIATLKVWVKKRKVITLKRAVNPATLGVHVVHGRSGNSLNAVSIRLPKWVGEWQTIKLTKLVPSLDTSNNDEHVIIDIAGQWWESGGSTADGGGAMVHQMPVPSAAYLKSFNRILHPQGL